jgi:hypothetical protein
VADEHAIILPAGVDRPPPPVARLDRGMVVNETDLPDSVVTEAVGTYIEEHASVLGVAQGTTFQTYANEGSLLARAKFRTPSNVFEEIALARDMVERDDDVGAAVGAMLALAFGEGMQHAHEDEVTVALFDEVARHANLDMRFKEMYREYLIAGAVTTVELFTRESFQFRPHGAERQRTRTVVAPLLGVLPGELVRVLDSDLFGTGRLAYRPATGAQENWLAEFFSQSTSAARKAEMRRENRVLASLLVEEVELPFDDPGLFAPANAEDPPGGRKVYVLNPRMVRRTTMPKGPEKYPRPPLTRNFALLEAKRLLNLMDYALLQGGANFLVVAKKGSDQRPAQQAEITNLRETIKRASRTGVIIGDHRLAIEVITPDLRELLNPDKRKLLARKLVGALLRVPDFKESDSAEGVRADVEIFSRVIASDRQDVRRHVENGTYREVARRNSATFSQGAAGVWFPKIVLQGVNYFTDLVLKLRDRGDISRKRAIEAGGFNYEAEVQQRRLEKGSGDDRVMTPAAVPFSSPNAGPQDNNSGRPRGSSSDNDRPPDVRPTRVVTRTPGETVRAIEDPEYGIVRIGERTHGVLEEYPDRAIGRLTRLEMDALARIADGNLETFQEGPLTIVPVNPGYQVEDVRAVRLATGLSMLVGKRGDDGALVARALSFRTPEFDGLAAEETALRWGYPVDPPAPVAPEPAERVSPAVHGLSPTPAPAQTIVVHAAGRGTKKVVHRDELGNITSIEEVPVDEPEGA